MPFRKPDHAYKLDIDFELLSPCQALGMHKATVSVVHGNWVKKKKKSSYIRH